jgi:hypothetical protein
MTIQSKRDLYETDTFQVSGTTPEELEEWLLEWIRTTRKSYRYIRVRVLPGDTSARVSCSTPFVTSTKPPQGYGNPNV